MGRIRTTVWKAVIKQDGSSPADLMRVSRWRNAAGAVTAVLFLLVLIGVCDTLGSFLLKPPYAFDLLAGDTLKINGPLPGRVKDVGDLVCESVSGQICVSIEGIHSGYWLGNTMWNGRVTTGPRTPPGTYRFTVKPERVEAGEAFPVFDVTVFEDRASYRRSSRSLIHKHVGIHPWWVVIAVLPLAGVGLFVVYRLSGMRDEQLANAGQAEVFRVHRTDSGVEIHFGLGAGHGIQPGSVVKLLGKKGTSVGNGCVVRALQAESVAIVDSSYDVKPGCLVAVEQNRSDTELVDMQGGEIM